MVIVKTTPDHLELHAPYHPALPPRAKEIGGKWRGAESGWVFALDQEAPLRSLCDSIWGVDGTPEALADTVALRVTVREGLVRQPVFDVMERPIYLAGREIAASLKNLRAARPGRGVRFLHGAPRCIAGSNTWRTAIPDGAVFVVRDLPRCAVARFREAVGRAGQVDVIEAVAPSR